MVTMPENDDLRLVLAVAQLGSVGAAARSLQISQPTASERLARLERGVGIRLFDRDTRGARATSAGLEMVNQARHILGHLERAFDSVRSAGAARRLRVGTISSLAEAVLPALDAVLDGESDTVVDHGEVLLESLLDGGLDAAVIAIVGRLEVPRALRAVRVGVDSMVILLPDAGRSVGLTSGHRFTLRTRVVVATYDGSGDVIGPRLIALGAQPQTVATIPAALAMARRRGCPAVVPRSAVLRPRRGEQVVDLPGRHPQRLDLVLPRSCDPRLRGAVGILRQQLRLD